MRYLICLIPDVAIILKQLIQGWCVIYIVESFTLTPLLAQSAIALHSAWIVACSWLSWIILICFSPGKCPLYPELIIRFSLTITHPTFSLSQEDLELISKVVLIKYSSQFSLLFNDIFCISFTEQQLIHNTFCVHRCKWCVTKSIMSYFANWYQAPL